MSQNRAALQLPASRRRERKPAGDAVGERGTPFRALVKQENAGIYIIAADGTVAYVNPYFMRMVGYEPAEVIGRPRSALGPARSRAVSSNWPAEASDWGLRQCLRGPAQKSVRPQSKDLATDRSGSISLSYRRHRSFAREILSARRRWRSLSQINS